MRRLLKRLSIGHQRPLDRVPAADLSITELKHLSLGGLAMEHCFDCSFLYSRVFGHFLGVLRTGQEIMEALSRDRGARHVRLRLSDGNAIVSKREAQGDGPGLTAVVVLAVVKT